VTNLADLTTIHVGGPAERIIEPPDAAALVAAVREVWATGDDWLLLGGGSNVLVSDDGFPGTVIHIATKGIESFPDGAGRVRLHVQAGEAWDDVVALAVDNGWAGLETLSGIPGSAGAAPIQNIGAYGRELSESLVSIEFLDYLTGDLVKLDAAELGLGYRTSAIRQGRTGFVVSIDLELSDGSAGGAREALSDPVLYDQLATTLEVEVGARVTLARVRSAVYGLRASKGMILNAGDPDSASCGSFFTNPIVGENFARGVPAECPRWLVEPEESDVAVPLGADPAPPPERVDQRVKLSAAWLIESAGIGKGFALPGSSAAISSKHSLAIVNRGEATAAEISQLARYIQTRVYSEYGVLLHPEPIFVGVQL
jgi:UDP-N-acetylmuramate dehydrogenase